MDDYRKLADNIDEMTDIEKKFALWYLLKDYSQAELNVDSIDNKDDYMTSILKLQLKSSVDILVDILGYDIF